MLSNLEKVEIHTNHTFQLSEVPYYKKQFPVFLTGF
jgi:hypothetical protein